MTTAAVFETFRFLFFLSLSSLHTSRKWKQLIWKDQETREKSSYYTVICIAINMNKRAKIAWMKKQKRKHFSIIFGSENAINSKLRIRKLDLYTHEIYLYLFSAERCHKNLPSLFSKRRLFVAKKKEELERKHFAGFFTGKVSHTSKALTLTQGQLSCHQVTEQWSTSSRNRSTYQILDL